MHAHNHINPPCPHLNMAYCHVCDMAYCAACGREWHNKSICWSNPIKWEDYNITCGSTTNYPIGTEVVFTNDPMSESTCLECLHGTCSKYGTSHT